MLGQTEWLDVEKAIRFAVNHGADRILLFGWSMGATIALILTEQSEYRHLIAGLVLISPVIDWKNCITAGARRAKLPAPLIALTIRALESKRWSQLIGADEPVDFRALNWTAQESGLDAPSLVIHSRGDETVPFADIEKSRRSHTDLVVLYEAPSAPHALEWNRSPRQIEEVIAGWIANLPTPGARHPPAPGGERE